MPALAGRLALIKASGTAVVMTDEPTSTSDNQTYTVTDAARRVWDRSAAITVEVGGVPTGETYTVNRLAGTVRFASVDAGRGAVTVTTSYLPMTTVARAHSFSLSTSADNQEVTAFGDDWRVRIQGMKEASASLERYLDPVDPLFQDMLIDSGEAVLEFWVDRLGSTPEFRMRARPSSVTSEAAVDGVVGESVEFEGISDNDGRAVHAF